MISSSWSVTITTALSSPRLPAYPGDPVIDGRPVPTLSGDLPDDFAKRLVRLKLASGLTWEEFVDVLGVEPKQALRWTRGTKPSGGAYHTLVGLAPWIPGGLDILMGEGFLSPSVRSSACLRSGGSDRERYPY